MKTKGKTSDSYYRSLTRNIILIIVGVSVVPLILITLTIKYFSQTSYQDKVIEHLQVLNKKHKQNIDSFLKERLADIAILKDSYSFDQLADDDFLREKLRSLQKNSSDALVDLGVVDEQGKQIAYAGPYDLRRANYAEAPWFKEAIQQPLYISDVFPGLRGIPHFIVSVRSDNGPKWLLRATVDFDKFNSLVENIRIGETGFAFILNRKGEFQTKPRTEVSPQNGPYLSFLSPETSDVAHEGIVSNSRIHGQDVIHVMSRLKNGDWVLAFQQTESDAYKALYTVRTVTVLIFFLGVIGIVVVSVLLSKRLVKRIRQADQEKEMMNEKVIEAGKLASVGELAAGIAHEINNPVAVMLEEAGWMQDLIADAGPGSIPMVDEFERSLSQIKAQGVRCKQITHKLLSFARKTDPVPKRVNINDITREAISLCEQRVRSGSVKIHGHFAEGLPPIRVSPSEAQQIFINLINNAIDAIEPKGGILKISTRREGDFIVADVADNGPGIPSYVLPRVFDPFFTTKPVGKGTGLGLSICYGIMKKLGGDITVNTAEGLGTTFHVKFPASKVIEKKAS
ncbi:MAG: cache domain-containing protein [Deltaproteobacteria bacterium]|nr:cache domain-containing protein [Deltaproteobacteria bacterium]